MNRLIRLELTIFSVVFVWAIGDYILNVIGAWDWTYWTWAGVVAVGRLIGGTILSRQRRER